MSKFNPKYGTTITSYNKTNYDITGKEIDNKYNKCNMLNLGNGVFCYIELAGLKHTGGARINVSYDPYGKSKGNNPIYIYYDIRSKNASMVTDEISTDIDIRILADTFRTIAGQLDEIIEYK